MKIQMKWLPGDKKPNKIIEEIIRVDHSGEFGAKMVYKGQILATKKFHRKNKSTIDELRNMYDQEIEHYEYFSDLLSERKIRPSVFLPIWKVLGFSLGYVSGVLGEKSSMACTVGIESVIGEHYQRQIDKLSELKIEENLSEKIQKFQSEELEHLEIGTKYNGNSIFAILASVCTTVAISIAKKY